MIFAARIERANRQAIRRSFFDMGTTLKKQAQSNIIDGAKTGRVYLIRRGGRRRRHQASAPGESPANMTGALRRGIGYKIQGSDRLEWGYSDKTPYGLWLEEGTPKMEPRPNIIPLSESIHKDARKYYFNSLRSEIMRLSHEIR